MLPARRSLQSPAFLGGEVGPELREPSAGPRAAPGSPAEAGGKARRRKPWRKPRRGPPMCKPGSHAALPAPPPRPTWEHGISRAREPFGSRTPTTVRGQEAPARGTGCSRTSTRKTVLEPASAGPRGKWGGGGGAKLGGPGSPCPVKGNALETAISAPEGPSRKRAGWGWGGRRGLRGRSHGHRRS